MDAIFRFTFQKASFGVRNEEVSERRTINWPLKDARIDGVAAMEMKVEDKCEGFLGGETAGMGGRTK